MKEKLKKLLGFKWLAPILLVVLILLQGVRISYVFAFEKEDFHSDEMYSYGLSNSHENPFLCLVGSIHDEYALNENVNNWISGSTLKDYIVVNDGEAFDYANVWYNQSLDRHPPLYYAMLHTVCSFFPNQFSPWFGFSINLVCFALIQLFLFLTARKLLKSNWLALLVCLCYGFSAGAVNLTVYIRMYCMTAMWMIILAYLHTRLLDKDGSIRLRSFIPFTVITMLGALTQHEFTITAFIFAVCFCIRFLCKKQVKNFFKYGVSMLLGVLLAWAIFPPLMGQIFTESSGNAAGDVSSELFLKQIPTAFEKFFHSLFGLHRILESDIIFWSAVLPTIIIAAVLFLIPICFLLRKNKSFIDLKKRAREKLSKAFTAIKGLRPVKALKRIKNISFMYLPLLLAVITIAIITAKSVPFYSMGYCDRYLFATFPLFILVCVGAAVYLLSRLFKKPCALRIASSVLFIVLLFNNVKNVSCSYLFEGESIGNLTELTADSECIIIEPTVDYEWRLVCFSDDMQNSDKVFYTCIDEFEENKDKINSLKTDKPVYVFLAYTDYFKDSGKLNFYITSYEESISEDEIFEKYFDGLNFCKKRERIGIITEFDLEYMVYRLQ